MCYQQGMVEGDALPRHRTCGILKGGKGNSVPFEEFLDQQIYDSRLKVTVYSGLIGRFGVAKCSHYR